MSIEDKYKAATTVSEVRQLELQELHINGDITEEEQMKAEIEIEYEVVEYRKPKAGDCYLAARERAGIATEDHAYPKLILKKKRWRADLTGEYWILDARGGTCIQHENHLQLDNELYNVGNYYRTKEEAESAAERVKKAYTDE